MTTKRINAQILWRIRNEIPIDDLIAERLDITWKESDGVFRFLCPACSDFHTATNPRTNLGRCFRCRRNFNAIDITMAAEDCDFLHAVEILRQALD
jgi:DNA primase